MLKKSFIIPIFACAIIFALSIATPRLLYGEVSETSISGARSLTLKDAVEIALLNNKAIQMQMEDVQFAKANILDAKSLFLPQVEASLGYTFNDAVLSTDSTPNKRKDIGVFSGYKNDNLFTISLNESVYNGGANIANLNEAKLKLKVQEETLCAAKLDVEFETKRLFYGLILAYETKRIANDLVDQAQAHYEEVNARFGQGTASKFDVLQSKVQVSRLMPQLVNAENAIELIKAEFKKLLSLDMREDTEIRGELVYLPVDIKEDEFLKEAYSNKPEMIIKLLGVDIKKWAIEYAKAGWLPQISANANVDYRSGNMGDMFNARHSGWSIGMKGSIALFDGFATKAKVDEAKALYARANLDKEDLIEQIAVDIKSACLNMVEAKAIIDSQKDSIVEAKEALRLANVRYDNGVGINLDVFDAEVALAQVEQNLAQGIYDYIMAKAQLDRTMGRETYYGSGH